MKNKHIIVTIRYSLLAKNFKNAWKIGDNSFEEYKALLFDYNRLKVKQEIFKYITLASLRKLEFLTPENIAFKVHILTSEEMPLENKDYLEKLVAPYDFIEIKKSSVDNASLYNDFKEYIDNHVELGDSYASIRLDDDDALSSEWLNEIVYYLNSDQYYNHVISLCGGYALRLDEPVNVEKMVHWKWRFASAGMAYIGRKTEGKNLSIYSCGNHSIPDDRYVTLLDARGKHFVRIYNNFNDSGVKFPSGEVVEKKEALNILLDNFGICLFAECNQVRVYDFHNHIIGYNDLTQRITKFRNYINDFHGLKIKLIDGKYVFFINDKGYLDIDDDCNFIFKDTPLNINYKIKFVSPVKFYLINKNNYYLSSLPSDARGYQWKKHLKAWEFFFMASI